MSEYWGVGILGCRNSGHSGNEFQWSEYWSVGILRCRNIGLLEYWVHPFQVTRMFWSAFPMLMAKTTPLPWGGHSGHQPPRLTNNQGKGVVLAINIGNADQNMRVTWKGCTQYSNSPIFRHLNIPTDQYSDHWNSFPECPLFRHPNIPTPQYSDIPIFRHPNIPTPIDPIFRQPNIPTHSLLLCLLQFYGLG